MHELFFLADLADLADSVGKKSAKSARSAGVNYNKNSKRIATIYTFPWNLNS
ncbi:hypothetical protein EV142_101464 [Flavobacterium circumlabens]|uniref:Uncharacterized protein n=1 Tax=Flavobacterium circumlabens TaxID=2133765 RepID=A0ABY2B428_9FLAO|nr:hypothetical protein EV142_101464 [Flavobacterium circumlabens]